MAITDKAPDWIFTRPYSFDLGSTSGGNDGEITIRLYQTGDIELTDNEAASVADEVACQNLYWSDERCCHWFYDFQTSLGYWAGSLGIEDNGITWNVEIHD